METLPLANTADSCLFQALAQTPHTPGDSAPTDTRARPPYALKNIESDVEPSLPTRPPPVDNTAKERDEAPVFTNTNPALKSHTWTGHTRLGLYKHYYQPHGVRTHRGCGSAQAASAAHWTSPGGQTQLIVYSPRKTAPCV